MLTEEEALLDELERLGDMTYHVPDESVARARAKIGRAIVLADIGAERDRQEQLKSSGRFKYTCADPEMTNGQRIAVLGEEFGEACRSVVEAADLAYDRHDKSLRAELIQVAAVAVAWVEALDKARRGSTPEARDDGAPRGG